MTQEQKELLLKDLCSRLPYGVKGVNEYAIISSPKDWRTDHTLEFAFLYRIEKYSWRPYLFPLSSMTEEQKRELQNYVGCEITVDSHDVDFVDYSDYRMGNWNKIFDWLNKNHFDYRGLIEKGLAIDATGLNIY